METIKALVIIWETFKMTYDLLKKAQEDSN